MYRESKRVAIPGSAKKRAPRSQAVAQAPPAEFNTTVILKAKTLPDAMTAEPLTRQQHMERHGADPDQVHRVMAFAQEYGLHVVSTSLAQRTVVLRGSARLQSEAFGVELQTYESPKGRFRGREGEIYIPEALASDVTAVLGLDNRPVARPNFRVAQGKTYGEAGAAALAEAGPSGFSGAQMATLYNFPKNVDGSGQTIGIIELGGGFRMAELQQYFAKVGSRTPAVSVASVGGGVNSPGTDPLDPQNADVEVMLDLQVAGAVAPGAHLVVYFGAGADDQSFYNVVSDAVHDSTNAPSVLSISWGAPENGWTAQFLKSFDDLLRSAGAMGITVCVASGDNGSAGSAVDDPAWDGGAHAGFPASSPYALACGGTRITVNNGTITDEVVWGEGGNVGTGGGVSRIFDLLSYQTNANVSRAKNPDGPVKRGVPDVAGNAAQESGYVVLCDGQWFPDPDKNLPPVGGTSAVAPLWAALIALFNQSKRSSVGFVNPAFYAVSSQAGAFKDVVRGNNGDYSAGVGWDACTGLGVANGAKLLHALS